MSGFDHTDPEEEHFGGIYRAIVISVADPEGLGRIVTKVPALNGDAEMAWAMPCVPMLVRRPPVLVLPGGSPAHTHTAQLAQNVDTLRLPQPGDSVWVMFEHGSIDSPVWMGSWIL